MKIKTRIFRFISTLLILVVFAGIGYVGDRGKNESVSSMENTSGNAAAGGGETLTIFHNRVWRNHS